MYPQHCLQTCPNPTAGCMLSTRQARIGFLKRYIHRNERGNIPHNSQHIATDNMLLVSYTLITDQQPKCIMQM